MQDIRDAGCDLAEEPLPVGQDDFPGYAVNDRWRRPRFGRPRGIGRWIGRAFGRRFGNWRRVWRRREGRGGAG